MNTGELGRYRRSAHLSSEAVRLRGVVAGEQDVTAAQVAVHDASLGHVTRHNDTEVGQECSECIGTLMNKLLIGKGRRNRHVGG